MVGPYSFFKKLTNRQSSREVSVLEEELVGAPPQQQVLRDDAVQRGAHECSRQQLLDVDGQYHLHVVYVVVDAAEGLYFLEG